VGITVGETSVASNVVSGLGAGLGKSIESKANCWSEKIGGHAIGNAAQALSALQKGAQAEATMRGDKDNNVQVLLCLFLHLAHWQGIRRWCFRDRHRRNIYDRKSYCYSQGTCFPSQTSN
jgi:hypothetical protein